MFSPVYFSGQYFPPVWFAPGDDSHLTDEETDTRRGHALRLQKVSEVYLAASSNQLQAKAGRLQVGSATGAQEIERVTGASVSIRPSMAGVKVGRVRCSSGCCAGLRGGRVEANAGEVRVEATQSAVAMAGRSPLVGSAGRVRVSIGAAAVCRAARVSPAAGGVGVKTIRNPTDEELVAMVRLTRRGRAGIQQNNWRV